MPWLEIVGGGVALIIAVLGYFGIQKSGRLKERVAAAEKGNEDAETVDKIMAEPLPTRRDRIRKLLRDR